MLFHPLKGFEDLFYGTLGKWNTEPVEIKLNQDAKLLSSRYDLVTHINKEIF